MKYFVANFKSHHTTAEAATWLDQFMSAYRPNEEKTVVLAPGFTNLPGFNRVRPKAQLAAQDVSPFPPGAYTGAVNARQLKNLGVTYCIVGHSERRQWFHQTHQDIANKVSQLLDQQITPIVCLDRPYLTAQLAALDSEWLSRIIVAYEPIKAIGSGQSEDPGHADQVAQNIKTLLPPPAPVIHGGSVTSQNAKDYTSQPNIDGLLIGGASLDPHEFIKITNQA